jgi:Protein of unknown function (DUF2384)
MAASKPKRSVNTLSHKPASAPPARPRKSKAAASFPPDLRGELESVLAEPDLWLNTPNDQFGGRTPLELVGTPDERLLHQWVGAVKHGIYS